MSLDTARLIKAVGAMLSEHEKGVAETIRGVREELAARIAELPAPAPGPPGRNGEDGRDGTDRVLAAPASIGPEQACKHNTIAHHKCGLWQAIRETTGDPDTDPAGWKCLVPGVAKISFSENYTKRMIVAEFETSDGKVHQTGWRMPAGYLPPDAGQKGWGIIAGDILRDGSEDFVALCDNPGNPLAEETAKNWQRMRVIGRRGAPGPKGDIGGQGEPGPGITGLTLVRDPANAGIAILPSYADKRVTAEPIAVDLMVEPAERGRDAIVGYAGSFHVSKRYGRGDVVSAQVGEMPGLFLSLKPDNRAALGDDTAWRRMI